MARKSLDEWLKYHGLRRFPFDRPEAGNEEFAQPEMLAACFVEPPGFTRSLGSALAPSSALLFAARGSGKTACRVMLDYYCRAGLAPLETGKDQRGLVLSVPHIHLSTLAAPAPRRRSAQAQVDAHIAEILRQAVVALTDLLRRSPEVLQASHAVTGSNWLELSWLCTRFGERLTVEQMGFLRQYELYAPAVWRMSPPPQPRSIGFPAAATALNAPDLAAAAGQVELIALWLSERRRVPMSDNLARWAALMPRLGVPATYVLIDGVDEFAGAAADPAQAYAAVRPLLADVRIMEGVPHLALKFFLPDSLRPLVEADADVRKDRGYIFQGLAWRPQDLIRILHRRLSAMQTDIERQKYDIALHFDELCTPEVRGQIEPDLAQQAAGNPRKLLVLCGLMVEAHLEHDWPAGSEDAYLLTRQDFETAVARYAQRMGQGEVSVTAPPPPFAIDQADEARIAAEVLALISQGEHEQLEFKSSMRFNHHTQNTDKDSLGYVIVRTIAGLMNRNGGYLLIGVRDDGIIIGIEHDLATVKNRNADGFMLALTELMQTHLRQRNALANLKARCICVQGRTVCMVEVKPSRSPVYIHRKDNPDELWVRLGNSTRALSISEAVSYVDEHW